MNPLGLTPPFEQRCVNHADEAERLRDASRDSAPPAGEEGWRDYFNTAAQVHATLALVDEQRTANLMTRLARLDGRLMNASPEELAERHALNNLIRTRLGIDLPAP
jgi:hypothetical protein